jgi:hypothetical protein
MSIGDASTEKKKYILSSSPVTNQESTLDMPTFAVDSTSGVQTRRTPMTGAGEREAV